MTADDVAALLRVPKSWVYAEARAGRIPYVTLGRYRRFRREALEAWLEARERGPVGLGDRGSSAPGLGARGRGAVGGADDV